MANKELPVVSFFSVLKNTNRILKNPLPFHRENFKKHGDHFRVKLGYSSNSVIFTRDALLAKHVFQKNHRACVRPLHRHGPKVLRSSSLFLLGSSKQEILCDLSFHDYLRV